MKIYATIKALVSATMICGLVAPHVAAQAPTRRYLALDASHRADLQNIQITNHQAEYVGRAFDLDQSWEQDLRVNYPGATVWDSVNNEYRLYYEVVVGSDDLHPNGRVINRHVAVATSPDGINWTRPALNITGNTYSDSPQNNFISVAGTTFAEGATVFIDPTAPSSERYKISYRDFGQSNGLALLTGVSADGLNFQPVGQIDDLSDQGRGLDSQNVAFWDPIANEYKSYFRYWYTSFDRRGVALHSNNTFSGDWNSQRRLTVDPDTTYQDNGGTQFYTPGISTYHGQYIGLPSVYRDFFSDGRISTGVLHSVDGENFTPADTIQDFFDFSVHAPNGDDFQIYAQPSIVERDGELLFYYSYFNQNHEAPDEVYINLEYETDLHIARLRQDGFTSLDSVGSETATWLTNAIALTADDGFLRLNAIINGQLDAEVIDADTLEVIDGFGLSDSSQLAAGDWLDGDLTWTGRSLSELNGRDVRFRFHFDDSSVFSFSIAPNSELGPPGVPFVLGDCNQDGLVNFLDIGSLIAVFTSGNFLAQADCNQDGEVNFLDIPPFIQILTNN